MAKFRFTSPTGMQEIDPADSTHVCGWRSARRYRHEHLPYLAQYDWLRLGKVEFETHVAEHVATKQ